MKLVKLNHIILGDEIFDDGAVWDLNHQLVKAELSLEEYLKNR